MKRYIFAAINPLENEPKNIRKQFAESTDISPRDLTKLAEDADPDVLRAVAKNPNTPVDILRRFAHGDDYLRMCLVDNPAIPEDVANLLAVDPRWDIRVRLTENPNISAAVLDKLYKDIVRGECNNLDIARRCNEIATVNLYQHPNLSPLTRERVRDLVEGMCTYIYIDGDRGESQPLSDVEIHNLANAICNDPTVVKCGGCNCNIYNDESGDDYIGEYSVNLVFDVLTNSEIDAVVTAVKSIIQSAGHSAGDWEATTY